MLNFIIFATIIVFIGFSIVALVHRKTVVEAEEKVKELKEKEEVYKSYESYEAPSKTMKRQQIEKEKENFEKVLEELQKLQKILIYVKKVTYGILVGLFVTTTVCSSIYNIKEQEQAVVTTFGKAQTVTRTGIHFKIPYVQKVKKVNSTIQGFPIGYQVADNESEYAESLMITSDFNFVNVDFYVEYRVNDPIMYLYGSSNPEDVLKNIAQASIRNTIGMYGVDDVLTTGKSEIQSVIKEDVVKELENNKTGLTLVNITIQDAEPPTEEVKKAFDDVETAKQGKEKLLNNAEQYRNEQIPKAKADADAIEKQAEAKKQERINEATGEVELFNSMFTQYTKDKNGSKLRMYYETMEELMPNLKIIINGTDSEIKPIITEK